MVGPSSGTTIKRDDGLLPALSSTNIFSALESRRRKPGKKRSDNEKESKSVIHEAPPVWTPTPVVTSWADCEDDEDDYFATVAPPLPVWSSEQPSATADPAGDDLSTVEESDGGEETEEEEEDEDEVKDEPETKASTVAVDGTFDKSKPAAAAIREPDRQLSKKELKKKELAELEAVLAELGLNQKDDSAQLTDEKKQDANGEVESGEVGPAITESKSSKRRKAKKEKSFKEGRDEEAPPQEPDQVPKDAVTDEVEVASGPTGPKEVLKRLTSLKKKKSFKENDSAAKAAAAEAAARAAKLAAAKKKEKNHYNQQPVR